MPTKGSKEQDAVVAKVMREVRSAGGIEHERNRSNPAGPDTHMAGGIGGGDDAGRKGKIKSGGEK